MIELQNKENQAKINVLYSAFEAEKKALMIKDEELKALNIEIERNKMTISALQNELDEVTEKSKEKSLSVGLSIDDYIQYKNQDGELVAKIEYFTASLEEQEDQKEALQESIFYAKNSLALKQEPIVAMMADDAIDLFLAQHEAELGNIKTLVYLGNNAKYNEMLDYGDKSAGGFADEYILERIKKKLTLNFTLYALDELAEMPLLSLEAGYKPLTPAAKHNLKFKAKTARGFNKLLNQ